MRDPSGFSPVPENWQSSPNMGRKRRAAQCGLMLLCNSYLTPCKLAEAQVVSREVESCLASLSLYGWGYLLLTWSLQRRCLHFWHACSLMEDASFWYTIISLLISLLLVDFIFFFCEIGFFKHRAEFFPAVTLMLPAVISQTNLIYSCWMIHRKNGWVWKC